MPMYFYVKNVAIEHFLNLFKFVSNFAQLFFAFKILWIDDSPTRTSLAMLAGISFPSEDTWGFPP